MIFGEDDLMDMVMRGEDLATKREILVDETVDIERAIHLLDQIPRFAAIKQHGDTIVKFDELNQQNWHMPQEYKDLDIAQHILDLCEGEAEIQRVGEELLLYQERDMFELLKYLKYLVDVMRENRVIWGVGRGSSVASFILFKLGVHRINSLHYKLEISEFLR